MIERPTTSVKVNMALNRNRKHKSEAREALGP